MWKANGQRLREWRTRRGHSQRVLANAAGITQGALSNYEAGRRDIPLSVALAIASELNVSLSDLAAAPDVVILRDSRLRQVVQALADRPELVEAVALLCLPTEPAPGQPDGGLHRQTGSACTRLRDQQNEDTAFRRARVPFDARKRTTAGRRASTVA